MNKKAKSRMIKGCAKGILISALLGLGLFNFLPANAAPKPKPVAAAQTAFANRPLENEIIYFLLPDRFANGDLSNDRGGNVGDRLKTGFDPNSKGYYQGGDIRGLIDKLDYIKGLGVTAIWVAPIFKNKVVQGPVGDESAGYHGYWVTDFTQVDPHFGTNAEFGELVNRAHAMGFKVYMDIIINHTADVIQYSECTIRSCEYHNKGDYPYSRRAGAAIGDNSAQINNGFLGDNVQTNANFAKLNNPNFAYSPYVPEAEKNVKVPAWLNNMNYYHNRGNSNWFAEGATYGDFSGLDDVMTEHPRVISGFIDVFGDWVENYKIDGFRIDTAKHVNNEFWHSFVPAIKERARKAGVPNFRIFAENYVGGVNPGGLANLVRAQKMPSTLDFSFQAAVEDVVANNTGTDVFDTLYNGDILYPNGEATAKSLETFISNHDTGRIAMKIKNAMPNLSEDELQKRVILGHAMMMFLRGSPVIYSGDEQGFVGKGGDQASRQPLFANPVVQYKDDIITGTDKTHADNHFDTNHPIYRALAQMAKIRQANPELINGRQIVRTVVKEPGILAISRIGKDGREALLVFNTSKSSKDTNVQIDVKSTNWQSLYGTCPAQVSTVGAISLNVGALDYAICMGSKPR